MNEKIQTNEMGRKTVSVLLVKIGLPMVLSMILQSIYNIVDTAFVINMGEDGAAGNLALTYSFPIQILIIALGVGTGIGINALLSKNLGEGNLKKVNAIVGNGIFLGICMYVIFLLFGIFFAEPFIAMQSGGNEKATMMGTEYLRICCVFSVGAVGFTVYERFLQATGKSLYSTIAQIAGAVANIVLDYVFIYPLNMGIAGAAWATVTGQIISLILAMAFHYALNKEIKNGLKYLRPRAGIIKAIYKIGFPAAIMQGLLAVMMLFVTMILGTAENYEVLQGAYGIYYKIQQFALFAVFGLSNTIITVLSYNYGMGDGKRSRQTIIFGILYSIVISAFITLLFEIFAVSLSALFGMANGEASAAVKETCVAALRRASLGYVFMGFSVAVQGVLQALNRGFTPLLISFLRLIVFVLPVIYAFTLFAEPELNVWWTFPIAECLTAIVAAFILAHEYKRSIKPMLKK